MSSSTTSSPVTSGLVLSFDPSNRKSLIPAGGSSPSLVDHYSWTVSNNGIGIFGDNATVANESQRILDTDPFGCQTIVWGTYPSGDSNADGGWNGSYITADKTKTYRYSVWVRRTSSTSGGTFYFGLHTNGTGDTFHLSNGASQTNPYWDYRGTGSLTQNQWYLVVGHIFPSSWIGTTAHPNSGYYIPNNVTKVASNAGNVPNDVKFPSDATTLMTRVYHYYCTDTTTRLQFAYPRIDLVDGTELTIAELVSKSPGALYDSISNIQFPMYNNPSYSRTERSVYFSAASSQRLTGSVPASINGTANTTARSWEVLAKPAAALTTSGIFGMVLSGGCTYYCNGGIAISSGNYAFCWYDNVSYNFLDSGVAATNGVDAHIIGTWDPADNKARIYVNGTLRNTSAATNLNYGGSVNEMQMGYLSASGNYFTGHVKLARYYYGKTLSSSEAFQNFSAVRSRVNL